MNNELTVLIVEDDPHVLLGCQQALALLRPFLKEVQM